MKEIWKPRADPNVQIKIIGGRYSPVEHYYREVILKPADKPIKLKLGIGFPRVDKPPR